MACPADIRPTAMPRPETTARNLLCALLHGEAPPPALSYAQIAHILRIDKAQVVRGVASVKPILEQIHMAAAGELEENDADRDARIVRNAARRRAKPADTQQD